MSVLFGIVADPHMCENNVDLVEDALMKAIDQCVSRKTRILFIIGDVFTNRKDLSFNTLQGFNRVLEYSQKRAVSIILIPGNHDKISYKSERSYLDIYKFHPQVTLHSSVGHIAIDEWNIYLLPFFDEKNTVALYLQEIIEMIRKKGTDKNVLLTHIAIDGVRNNDGSVVTGVVSRDVFSLFEKVIVGHYHDKQEVDNIIYIGSLYQNDFGEDERKGITFFHENGDLEQVSVIEPQYLTVPIDLSKYSLKDVKTKLLPIYRDTAKNIRFQFLGTKDELSKVETADFLAAGIKTSARVIEETVQGQSVDFGGFNKEKILQEWKSYCSKIKLSKALSVKGTERLQL